MLLSMRILKRAFFVRLCRFHNSEIISRKIWKISQEINIFRHLRYCRWQDRKQFYLGKKLSIIPLQKERLLYG